ncbi:MAG: OmpH family outer membrane protein [Terriglobales bacterium]
MSARSLIRAAAVCVCAAGLTLGAAAQAKPATPPAAAALSPSPTATGPSRLAFINFQGAIEATTDGKKLLADLQKRFAPRQSEINNTQAQIAALQKQQQDGGNTMSQAAKDQLSQQLQAKERDYQQSVQNFQTDSQDALTGVLNTVGNKMAPIIKQYVTEHGYTAVVDTSITWPQSPLLYVADGNDITGDIVRLYNKAHAAPAPSGPPPQN